MQIAIRCDASHQIGGGHVMRMLALAQALRKHEIKIDFICREQPGHLNQLIYDYGYPVHPLAADQPFDPYNDSQATSALLAEPVDWLIIDHYDIARPWQQRLRQHAHHLCVIDDLAQQPHECDVLLNQNFAIAPAHYQKLVPPTCRLLLGPRYALLREEFLVCQRRIRSGTVKRLFISFGASDPHNTAQSVMQALYRLLQCQQLPSCHIDVIAGPSNPHWQTLTQYEQLLPMCQVRRSTSNMASVMSAADLAIGAGGGSLWERCYLGLPACVIWIADNQRAVTTALATQGALWNWGCVHELSIDNIMTQLMIRFNTPEQLSYTSNRALEIMQEPLFIRNPLPYLTTSSSISK
jgi:UDP-2,4-diacetamido-2,4,6-trideoxy-beta-L-altropyranose hydrolase